ncbi:MAG: hypothetical protein GXC73_17640 [Chitinophagaceae bacterium]|nr:hypothetical protein [Chitinophagaceae bacterium]
MNRTVIILLICLLGTATYAQRLERIESFQSNGKYGFKDIGTGNVINQSSLSTVNKENGKTGKQNAENSDKIRITTAIGLSWEFPDNEYKADSSDVEKMYHYVTPLKDAEIYIKIVNMGKMNKTITNGALYPLASERIKDLKADGFDVKGVESKDYLKSVKSNNLVLGYLATHSDGDILFFYTHKNNYVISIHIVNYNAKLSLTQKDLDAFLNSVTISQ